MPHSGDSTDVLRRLEARRRELGSSVVVLGHHYQSDDVIRFADIVGDSLKLASAAARHSAARYIVLCGVHFMAESVDILTDESVAVVLPDPTAGCSMAEMATLAQVEEAWEFLARVCRPAPVPVAYVNSSADIKAFCGERGGACCTSGNAQAVLRWAARGGSTALFVPDQHLGRNAAHTLGVPATDMAVYDPRLAQGGLSRRVARRAKVVLWKGHCGVHQLFTPEQCDSARRADPQARIVVHPECRWEVARMADAVGSTEYIIRAVDGAPAGSRWAIGTETNLVARLARLHPEQAIRSLSPSPEQCTCPTMSRINPERLLLALDGLAGGHVANRVQVPAGIRWAALVALNRMLENT